MTTVAQALSEIVEGGFFTGKSADWRGKGVDIAYSGAAVSGTDDGAIITVPANGEATVGVDVKPGAAFDSSVAQNTPNGTFLDGFVRFASKTASQPDLTVPYLGLPNEKFCFEGFLPQKKGRMLFRSYIGQEIAVLVNEDDYEQAMEIVRNREKANE